MTTISTRAFGGEIPRSPADKLPEPYAQRAVNCNFAYQELRPTKAGFFIRNLANAAKSLFTTNGLTFATWPYKAKAWKGPVTNDKFNRFYFTSRDGGFRVSQTTLLATNGGEPSTSYAVGVPAVEAAPTYTLVDRTSLPDHPNAMVKLYSYYEANGKRYEEKDISSFVTVKPFREFTFTIQEPAYPEIPVEEQLAAVTVSLTSLTYINTVGEDETVGLGGSSGTVLDASTVSVGGTTYRNVLYVTPVGKPQTTPDAILQSAAASGGTSQAGDFTPASATATVRIDVVDSATNSTIFSLTASSAVGSTRSDAVPGGVDASLVKDGSGTGNWKLELNYGPVATRAYVVTMLNIWNEESKPSPPVLISPTYLQSVQLTFVPPTAGGYVTYNRFRVYRSVGTGDYLSVTPSPVSYTGAPVTYLDELLNIKDTDAVLATIGWDAPPTNLQGLTLMPNGFFAAFSGDTLYFSEPYRPWAWPYVMTFPVPLVGMRAIENSLVVTTNSYPYLVSGVHPNAVTQAQLTTSQAGISDHGMCVVGSTVAYVSNDGLAVVSGYNVDLTISQKLWTRETWRAEFGDVLNDLELAYHDGALVCGSPTAGKMWELRLDNEGGGNLSMLDSTMRADAMYVLPASDQLYYVNGTGLYQYKGGSDVNYDWWSKDYILAKPTLFTAVYVNTSAPATVTVYADGATWHTQRVSSAGYYRMPTGKKSLRWSFRIEGKGIIKEFSMAERREELRSV